MTAPRDPAVQNWLDRADDWQRDREAGQRRALAIGYGLAGVMTLVALCEAFALAALSPLKTAVPYTLLVDRQTGYVETLKPLDQRTIAPDAALTRSMIAQYVLAREGFDVSTVQSEYRKVVLWSSGEARDRYVAGMQPSNPVSPLARYPRRALVEVEIRGLSSLAPNVMLVRYATRRTDLATNEPPQVWQAVVSFRFSNEAMSAADRLVNPLGFQVVRYRRDAETIADPVRPVATGATTP